MQDVNYQWDAVGNLLTRGDATQSLSESFGYDSLNRVTSAIVAGGPAKTFAYDSIGNITTKSDVGSYTYPLPGSARPHAVIEVSGSLNATYSYDANGNLTAGAGRTVTYASFNLPTQITRGAVAVSFTYGPEHQRITQVSPDSTTVYLHPDGKGAPFIEKVVMGATVQWNNYLYANGAMVGVLYERNPGGVFTRYFLKDHLGSIAVITDETGAVLERLSYDAWGKRRFPNGADDPAETITSQSDRGFTGHEHLSDVGLIHMNGRIYDPVLGRFMTADQVIDGLFSTQGLNRYGYVHNNPLAYTDPLGLFSFRSVLRAITGFLTGGVFLMLPPVQHFLAEHRWAQMIIQIAAAATGNPYVAAITSAYLAGINGGDVGDMFKAAALTYAQAMAFKAVGDVTLGPRHPIPAPGSFEHITNVIGHAAVGCAITAAGGGSCRSGAMAAGFSSFAGPVLKDLNFEAKLVAKTVIGGTASVLGGGKFENGAITAAFGYLYNEVNIYANDPLRNGRYGSRIAPVTQEELTGIIYNENAALRGEGIQEADRAVGEVVLNRQSAGMREIYGTTLATPIITGSELEAIARGYGPAVEAYRNAAQAAEYLFDAPGALPSTGGLYFNHRIDGSTAPFLGRSMIQQYGPFSGSRYRYLNVYE